MLAGANHHDSPLLAPTLDRLDDLGPLPDDVTLHLDAGYDSDRTRTLQRRERAHPGKSEVACRTNPRLAERFRPDPPSVDHSQRGDPPPPPPPVSLHRLPRPRLLIQGTSQWSMGRTSPARWQDLAGNLTP